MTDIVGTTDVGYSRSFLRTFRSTLRRNSRSLLFLVPCLTVATVLYVSSERRALVPRNSPVDVYYTAQAYSRRPRNRPRNLGASHLSRLRHNGVLISALTANSVVTAITRPLGPRPHNFGEPPSEVGPLGPRPHTFGEPPSEVGPLVPFHYSTCPLQSSRCVESHPLPEVVWDDRVAFCLHSSEDAVSNALLSSGVWNSPLVFLLWATLLQEQDMHLIDVGANVGTLAAVAGKLGRQVIALESLQANVDVLCNTVVANDLTGQVIIFHNAVANRRTRLKAAASGSNMASVRLLPVGEPMPDGDVSGSVSSVYMDDILQVIVYKKVFININIAEMQYLREALQSASAIFTKLEIPIIAMTLPEPRDQAAAKDAELVVEILSKRGYKPYQLGGKKLEEAEVGGWRGTVYWLQRDYRFQVDPWSLYRM